MKKVVAMLMLVGVSLFSVGAFAANPASNATVIGACTPGVNC